MNSRPRKTLIELFFGFVIIYAALNAYQTLRLWRSNLGWETSARSTQRVALVFPDGPATVLRPGDELIAENGQPISTVPTLRSLTPGTDYVLTVRRNGELHDFNLRTAPISVSDWLTAFILVVLFPAISIATGLAVFLLKPDNKHALLLALAFGCLIPPLAFHWYDGLPRLLAFVMFAGPLVTLVFLSLILHLFLVFPERSPILRRWPRLEWVPYLPVPFLIWINAQPTAQTAGSRRSVYATVMLLATTFSLLVNYRRANEVSRRKLRVLMAGVVAAFVPGMLIFFTLPLFNLSGIDPGWTPRLRVIGAMALPLLPLSFAYAIVRHRVIPISLIIRRSVQYLLAKNGLRLLLALPIAGVVVTVLANPHRTLDEILLHNSIYFYALLTVAIGLGLMYHKHLSDWVDRQFFRESYHQETILHALIDDVKRLDSISEMSLRVSQQVERALHPEHTYLFYREEDRRDLSLGYSSDGSHSELRIPEEFELLRFVEYQGGALDFPFPLKTNLPQTEKDWLARLGTQLIVPMTGTDNHLAGLFLLGEKKSQVPYTAGDRNLLEALADQIAIVYENVRLKERVDKDRRIKHEVLSRVHERDIHLLKECPKCGACFDSSAHVCEHDGQELTLTLPVERTVENRYRLDKLIGRGGMGSVYEGRDLRLNRSVAIKILGGQLFGNSEALRRFEREAQTSARLSHHHIITVYDYGVLSTEGAYLVMELVRGETLGRVLKREGFLTPAVAADWFDQVLTAIAAAHAADVIHRDLKPENIFIAEDESGRKTVKILDFGLAKLSQPEVDSKSSAEFNPVTKPGVVLGTFGYMSPEQLMGEHVDARTDVFSVGVMIVEALTGRRPFAGKTYHELLSNIANKPFHLTDQSLEVSRLDEALGKCLAKDPAARCASAREAQQCLIPAIRNCLPQSLRPSSVLDAETAILNS